MFDAAVGAVGWQGMLNTTASDPTMFVAQEQGDTLAAYPICSEEKKTRSTAICLCKVREQAPR